MVRIDFISFLAKKPRIHVHITSASGEAKFWVEPAIELAMNYGLNQRQLNAIERIVGKHEDEIREAWKKHFGG